MRAAAVMVLLALVAVAVCARPRGRSVRVAVVRVRARPVTHQLSPPVFVAVGDRGVRAAARARHLALTVSLHMNERGGSAFPSLGTLSDETGLDRRTVMRTLKVLRRSGYLAVERAAAAAARTGTPPLFHRFCG